MLLRNRIARVSAAGTLVLTAPLLTGCGMDVATDAIYTPAEGTNERDSRVDVLGAAIVATENGEGTFIATLVNNETAEYEGGTFTDAGDELTGISAAGEASLEATLEEPVEIDGGGLAKLADETGVPVEGEGIVLGTFVELELTFGNADPVRIEVPVLPNNGAFAGQDGPRLTPTSSTEDAPEGGEEGAE